MGGADQNPLSLCASEPLCRYEGGISFALVGAIVGEFVAGNYGIGFQILVAQGQFDTVRVFVSLLLLGIVGTVLFFLVDYAERLLLALAYFSPRSPCNDPPNADESGSIRREHGADRHRSALGQQSRRGAGRARRGAVAGAGVLALAARGVHSHHRGVAGVAAGVADDPSAAWGIDRRRGDRRRGVFLFAAGGAYQSLAIEVGFLNATTPVWVLLLGRWMDGGQLTAGMKGGIALAFAGTLLIISKGRHRY